MIFECKMTERTNAQSEVTARGVEWCEPRRFMESALVGVGGWGWKLAWYVAFFGVVFGLLLRVEQLAVGGIIIGIALFALGTALIWFGARFPGTPRSLLFRHDGFVAAPHGVAGRPNSEGKWQLRHQDIMNIEAVQTAGMRRDDETEYTHAVHLLLTNGKKIRIASHLKFDDAALVVSSLMLTLMLVRDEVSIEVGDFVETA